MNDDSATGLARLPDPPEAACGFAEVRLADGVRLLQRDRSAAPRNDGGCAAAESEREPARVITMVWGDRYIVDLLEITLPALLAPGNLPALAAAFACEVVIVTETRLFDRISRSATIINLLRFADLRLVPIDDLLSPWYGITLTYALLRGFTDLGEAMTRTHLFFLNADFILADGSYRRLAEAVKRGERLVCAPSYCMNLEATIDGLHARRDAMSGGLQLPPRELAEIIIANRHNTIRAKTINQQLFRIHRYDQFYWYVDDKTLIGRQMPIAVVYMRPERVLSDMRTFWDYGVISEFCPSVTPCVLGDSDDFLMAELRSEGTFRELLHLGWPSAAEIAADLSSFTTKDHRDYGRFTLVLHAGDLPPAIEAAKAQLTHFVDDVYDRLRPPISYRDHPFWAPQFPQFLARQTQAYRLRRADEAAQAALIRQDAAAASREQRIASLRARLLAGAERARIDQRRLDEKRRFAEARLGPLEDEYRRRRAALEGERDQALFGEEEALRRLDDELASLAGEASDLERQQNCAADCFRLAGAPNDDAAAAARGEPTASPEIVGSAFRDGFLAWCGRVYRQAFGTLSDTTRWHPYHAMLRPAVAAVAAGQAARVLVVSSDGIFASAILRDHRGEKLAITPGMVASEYYRQDLSRQAKFDLCLCDLAIDDLVRFRALLDKLRPLLTDGARIVVFHHNLAGRALDEWTHEFTRGLFPVIGRSTIAFAGSYPGAISTGRFAKSLRRHNVSRPASVLALTATLAICAPLARLATAIEPRRAAVRLPKHCTSMTILIDLP